MTHYPLLRLNFRPFEDQPDRELVATLLNPDGTFREFTLRLDELPDRLFRMTLADLKLHIESKYKALMDAR
ncbi:hypothetical protein [Pseudomonas sp. TE3610]